MSIVSSRLRRPVLITLATTALLTGMLIAAPAANAAVLTQSLGPELTATQLAGALVGEGVTVSNAQFTGANAAGGTFTGGGIGPGSIVGFDQGVILSSGAIASVPGPNTLDNATTANGTAGDASLDALLPAGQLTEDAAVLTFDFVPNASSVSFRYVFSSDEYNEFVNVGFNDVFAFFVNGTNCATVDGQPVTVDTVNGGNPFGTAATHPELFRNNDPNDPGPPTIDTQMDGLTTVLTCTSPVSANATNTMKLAIADVNDANLDSNVFIEAGSLTTEPPDDVVPGAPTGVTATPGDGSALVGWTAPGSDGGSAIDGYTVTCTATANGDDTHTATADGTTTSATVTGLTNDVEYTCTVTAHNAVGDSEPSAASAPFTPIAPDGGQFSTTIDTAEGGVLEIVPPAGEFQGTVGRITIPPQGGTGVPVTVTASLFGTPGEIDATCGGNVCIGQGIEWGVSDPSAIQRMRVAFFLSKSLVRHRDLKHAAVYKDGIALPNCTSWASTGCVLFRTRTPHGGWWITIRVNGEDPKGRI